MTKEALKLALEALETPWNAPYVDGCDLALGKRVKAITAIKEALANEALDKMAENARELGLDYEPEQDWIERERAVGYREGHQNAIKQMAQPEQPKVRTGDCLLVGVCASEGHKIAPQRKPLTDEEIQDALLGYRLVDAIDIARAIESAHGIKE